MPFRIKVNAPLIHVDWYGELVAADLPQMLAEMKRAAGSLRCPPRVLVTCDGVTAVNFEYANANAQMQGLMENAAGDSKSLGLQYGKALTPQQQSKLAHDIVWMVQTVIDGKTMECLALNDVLFAGSSPAETVRCRIRVGRCEEFQKSSGVWVASGPGSTAAIHSAGGKKMPLRSHKLQN